MAKTSLMSSVMLGGKHGTDSSVVPGKESACLCLTLRLLVSRSDGNISVVSYSSYHFAPTDACVIVVIECGRLKLVRDSSLS